MNDDINPFKALDFMRDNAPAYAMAKGNVIYMTEFRKSLKATLMTNCDAKTQTEREAYAYAHSDYVAQLEALKIATEEEERLKYMLSAAQARIEVWKTQEYSKRQELKNL